MANSTLVRFVAIEEPHSPDKLKEHKELMNQKLLFTWSETDCQREWLVNSMGLWYVEKTKKRKSKLSNC